MTIAVITPTNFRTCGFCSTGHHRLCAIGVEGAVNNDYPEGRVWPCTCDKADCETRPRIKCLDCGNRVEAEVNPATWRCADIEACKATIQQKRDSDPLLAEIREAKEKAKMATTEKSKTDKAKAAPKVGKCLCCDGATKGGNFLPGHDARFVSMKVSAVQEGNETKAAARKTLGDVSANLAAKFDKSIGLAEDKAAKAKKAAADKAAEKKAAATAKKAAASK